MPDEYQDSVIEQVAPEETQQNDSPEVSQTNVVDQQQINWRASRQRQKELEWELKQKDEMLNRLLQQQQPQQQVIPEPEIPDDDFVPVKGVKGIAKKAVQPLERKIEELEKKLASQEQEKRLRSLKSQYPDFDDVVNVETLEIFEKMKPGLAATISKLDPYDMGIQSYEFIKSLGILDQLPDARRKKEIDTKLEKNSKTVQSPMAYDKRPIAQAFKSTQAEKTRLYEEMMEYASKCTGF